MCSSNDFVCWYDSLISARINGISLKYFTNLCIFFSCDFVQIFTPYLKFHAHLFNSSEFATWHVKSWHICYISKWYAAPKVVKVSVRVKAFYTKLPFLCRTRIVTGANHCRGKHVETVNLILFANANTTRLVFNAVLLKDVENYVLHSLKT